MCALSCRLYPAFEGEHTHGDAVKKLNSRCNARASKTKAIKLRVASSPQSTPTMKGGPNRFGFAEAGGVSAVKAASSPISAQGVRSNSAPLRGSSHTKSPNRANGTGSGSTGSRSIHKTAATATATGTGSGSQRRSSKVKPKLPWYACCCDLAT